LYAIDNEAAQPSQAEPSRTQQTEHLLIISIGPVQDFIAAARKCQDLWFGSFLLSELSARIAESLKTEHAELIFPGSKLEADDKVSVANKVVARLPSTLPAKDAVKRAETQMRDWLRTLETCAFDACEEVISRVPRQGEQLFLRDIAKQQVADLIELQWVAVPITASYVDAHQKAERLLAWRKNTRDFGRVPWDAANVPKSSIDGQRESVIREEFFECVRNEVRLGSRFRLGKNERLCGVGILKRFGTEIIAKPITPEEESIRVTARPVFHSNSHVAAGPLLKRIRDQGTMGKKALDEYIHALNQQRVKTERFQVPLKHLDSQTYDGTLFYPDRLPEVFEESSTLPAEEQKEAVRRAQAALQTFFEKLRCTQSEPYYVMLAADGDHMGAAIRALAEKKDGIAQHQALSDRLAKFAQRSRSVIEEHAGSLIYSGGDDVLALLPLHTALACARALKEEFDRVGSELERKPTLSVGLAVVHHLEHMGRARKLAHQAEKLAKRKRNSLAIIVDKRSGGTIAVTGSWDEEAIDQRIQAWVKLLEEDKLPDGVAFELLEVLAPFEVPSPGAEPTQKAEPLSAELQSLVKRVLGRKRTSGGQSALGQDLIDKLSSRIKEAPEPIAAVRDLSYELQIAREFLRAKRLAEGGQPQ
jgi:CRISPR-associated protein Cmr2